MLNIGNIYNTPVRRIAARVDLYNGSTLVSSYTNTDKIITIDIQRTGETSKFFGFTICHRLNFHILDPNREIVITTANSAKVKIGEAEFPTFFVSEVHRDENTNELSITAYDALKKASALQVDSLTLVKPYTTQQVIDCAAAAIGVAAQTFEDTTFNTSYSNGINIDGTETVREILNAACEATFTIGYLNKNDILVFKRLSNSSSVDLAITKEDYFSLSSGGNRRLASIAATTELGNNVSTATAQSGTTQYVKDNPFWDLRNDVDTILNYGISTVGGLTINEFECSWRGNPALEIGDKISVTTKDNRTVTAFLLDDTLTYDGGLSQKTQWTYEETDETETNSVNLGDKLRQTYAKVDKVNKQVDIVVSKVDGHDSTISQIQLDQKSINASVGSITNRQDATDTEIDNINQKVNASITSDQVELIVQEELAGGVNKVTTSTGFTFNQEGLTIKKSDVDITTNISEDGMRVSKGSEVVLTADNGGVEARNLHATTYLIIGGNSRFEDYNNGSRTGCFWIGG